MRSGRNLRFSLPVVACSALWAGQATAAPVKVDGGLVQGIAEADLNVYKGVPFAAPPVGDLRWRPPQPAAPWPGVLKADRFAPGCIPSMGEPPPSGASEDCLYLNVWTPATSPGDRLPALVWIYGGGFNAGATSVPVHDGARLARRGVVLVTVAYRVGVLGFHAQPELSAESAQRVSGNYGLLDMIAALQWIERNVAAFGGDPKRVTIFGESAGGIAVSMLCASPLAKGLFHGAISQSGGSFGPSSRSPVPGENMRLLADAEASGAELARLAGARSLTELRALPADKVVAAGRQRGGMAWPIVDGWVIPDDQHKLYESGRWNDTPILVGYNSDEGLSFTRARTPEDYVAGVRQRYGPFADRVLEAYPTAVNVIPKTARDLARDSAFGWHTWVWARLQSARGKGKAYYYYFDQHPERAAGSPEADHGSPHGIDVPYVFENLDAPGRTVTEDDRRISDAMAAYWTNFAKRGDPNGEGQPTWPAFSDGNPTVMYFSRAPRTGPVPSEGSLRVLDRYFAWRRSPEGAARPAETRDAQVRAVPPAPVAGALRRSEVRIRDPFVLADRATKTYYVYSSTTHGIDSQEPLKQVVVYASKDLETWDAPRTVLEVPPGHWGRETVWAPEVHLYKGRYYLFVTLTSTDTLPTPEGRPQNLKRGTEIFVADRAEGPFRPLGKGPQTPPEWMALDGTLWVEDGVPYMVFAHEWIQITDGSMDLVRLADDLSVPVGAPRKLFHASEADWVRCRGDLGELFQGRRYHAYITDGAWLHRTQTGKLVMLWSSYGPRKYATGVATSASGTLAGPWIQQKEPLFDDDGGHPMLFRAFDGRLLMVIHQPNRRVERARFFEMDDSGDSVRLVRELTGGVQLRP